MLKPTSKEIKKEPIFLKENQMGPNWMIEIHSSNTSILEDIKKEDTFEVTAYDFRASNIFDYENVAISKGFTRGHCELSRQLASKGPEHYGVLYKFLVFNNNPVETLRRKSLDAKMYF